jgi:hypothetical protein
VAEVQPLGFGEGASVRRPATFTRAAIEVDTDLVNRRVERFSATNESFSEELLSVWSDLFTARNDQLLFEFMGMSLDRFEESSGKCDDPLDVVSEASVHLRWRAKSEDSVTCVTASAPVQLEAVTLDLD